MSRLSAARKQRLIAMFGVIVGVLLTLIGTRYFLVPEGAARTFGVPGRPTGYELHYIIGLRNVWLGLLAVAFALLREWRALALWFAIGTIVCFADAFIAATSTGRLPQVAFHTGCGLVFAGLAAGCWRMAARPR
ncbi:MAG: DUF4267 domain-containing protein [Rhodospirillales bacterium]|nr:DUF4267 domain-containing protein [Rhodospirillales bacterium]